MKKNRIRLISLTLFLSLLLLIFVFNNRIKYWFPQKFHQPFSSINKKGIFEISIIDSNNKIVLSKKNHWLVKKEGQDYQADEERINKILDNIVSLKKEEIVSNNENRHKDLGIKDQKIILKSKDKTHVLFIGNSSSIDKNYLKINNENDVFITSGFTDIFTNNDFRDLKLNLIQDEESIDRIIIAFEEKTITLDKKKNKNTISWQIDNKTLKKEKVDFFINNLITLKANDILVKNIPFDNPPALTIKLQENKEQKIVQFYLSINEQNFQKQNYYLAKISTSDKLFSIADVYVSSLIKEEKDFTE